MSRSETAYRRKTPEARRQQLIDAGIKCLGKGGMAGFTIDQICKTAHVSRGLINHHFKSKDELLVQIYEAMTDHLIDDRSWPGPELSLKAIIDTSFDDQEFNRSNLRAWLSIWGQVPDTPALRRIHQIRYRAYQKRITRKMETGFK